MSSDSAQETSIFSDDSIDPAFDWLNIARLMLISRAIDRIEETELVPQKKVLYQFSAPKPAVMLSSCTTRQRLVFATEFNIAFLSHGIIVRRSMTSTLPST